jgi:predicted glycosyltransferase/glycosyltransferase involved in cell wall biosynthesis/ADP-heptose:LPS heptosyltransferase
MKILIHSQHFSGTGHYFRSHNIAQMLVPDHQVWHVNGGKAIPNMPQGTDINHVQLLPLTYSQGMLVTPDNSIHFDQALIQRKQVLSNLIDQVAPDIFLTEFFPFDRWPLTEEYLACLAQIRIKNPSFTTICSLRDIPSRAASAVHFRRDIFGPKTDWFEPPRNLLDDTYRDRVIEILNKHFNYLFVHADPWVTRLEEHFPWVDAIDIPIFYTGYVSQKQQLGKRPIDVPYVLVSVGGGLDGTQILNATIDAWELLISRSQTGGRKMVIFSGPFIPESEKLALAQRCKHESIQLNTFTNDFSNWLYHADYAVNKAGYNTCVDVLQARTPNLLIPVTHLKDGGYRAFRFSDLGISDVLNDTELSAESIASCINKGLNSGKVEHSIDIGGAKKTADLIGEIDQGGTIQRQTPHFLKQNRDKLNILFLMNANGFGGSEAWLVRMANEMVKRGHFCAMGAPQGSPLHNASGALHSHFTYTYLDGLTFQEKFQSFIRQNRINMIVCTPTGENLEWHALQNMCHSIENPPTILFKFGLPYYKGAKSHYVGYGLHAKFRRLLLVCEHNKQSFLKYLPELSSRYVKVQYTGIDLNYFRPDHPDLVPDEIRNQLGIPDDARIVTNVSRLSFLKGHHFLIQAAQTFMAEDPNVHLIIVGTGSDKTLQQLKTLTDGLGLEKRIHFCGFQIDVRSFIAASDFFVHPSLVEGIPNAVLEAMAMGKACIATRVGGTPELIEDGKHGCLIQPSNIEALSQAVSRLLNDSSLRNNLAQNAYDRAQDFSISLRAEQFEKHLIDAQKPDLRFSWRTEKPPQIGKRKKKVNCVKRILIHHFEGMGDLVQAIPALYLIRHIFKTQEITLVLPGDRMRLVEHIGIDTLLGLKTQTQFAEQNQGKNYDVIFDFNVSRALEGEISQVGEKIIGFSRPGADLEREVYLLDRKRPLWQNLVGLLRGYGVYDQTIPWKNLRPTINPEEDEIAESLLSASNGKLIVGISPGGFTPPEKQWGTQHFARLLNELGKEFPIFPVLLGHYREVPLTWELEDQMRIPCANLANRYPGLGVLLALIERMHFHITNDNGVMHLSALMDKPQIALFGPTNHHFFGPMGKSTTVINSPTTSMEEIDYDEVISRCKKQIKTALLTSNF